jgi:A/G-specific adenine glycosylase
MPVLPTNKDPVPMRVPTEETLQYLHRALCTFYAERARDLPWRRTQDPWAIWVSEIMLQQTQVDTVVPRYPAFLRQFPSPTAMAAASVEQVCEAWAGLGYYRRARSLHRGAQVVVQDHGAEVPRDLATLKTLPGVGPYTAGAIASIAFHIAAPIVDGNVVRVLSRLFLLSGTLATKEGRHVLWDLATRLVQRGPGSEAGAFNQALMELGATVCTPKNPTCLLCPVRTSCGAYETGQVQAYPVPVAARPLTALAIAYAYRLDADGLWLWQRGVHGLWAGMWEMPSGEGPSGAEKLHEAGIRLGEPIAQVQHLLTHRKVTATLYRGLGSKRAWLAAGARPIAQPLAAPLSSLARKAIVAATASMV